MRVEYRAAVTGFTTSDVFRPVYVPAQSNIRIGGLVLVNMPNPYNPFYILDVELAKEYASTPSFDQEASKLVCRWATADRAAMGLCLENVPVPFQSGYLVPVSSQTNTTPSFAWVSHLPNNYADNTNSPLGKVRMDGLFAGASGDDIAEWSVIARGTPRRASGDGKQPGPDAIGAEKPTGGELSCLITDHDTILYIDDASRRVKHAP